MIIQTLTCENIIFQSTENTTEIRFEKTGLTRMTHDLRYTKADENIRKNSADAS